MRLADLMGPLLGFVARAITGAQGHWLGCPPSSEQRIYIANHQSHFDLVLIWAALPSELRPRVRAIAARDYWTKSRFKTWLTTDVFNTVYVSRTRSNPDEDPLEPLIEALHAGDSLLIFPEGTRSALGEPLPFKSGIYHLAEQFPEVKIIPTWIDNVQRVMPKGEVVPVPILCTVTFGTPTQIQPDEDKKSFLERTRSEMMALKPGGWKK
ncbi:lysophospholipid acyltransferase family protein [Inhella gelatinilytica]|uniref:1-acyl-sn-glycerol-3-phosphate acyltransferase n=1 Tax=Inhella gelatinilytica TaxID=2795030 RepID=A0A931IXC0_9BURK|nr:lysophospholipid acyltransferase family protein [Inhella gelatinilytica]MBH9552373.1 1-acyl-sn-glycerol-3-phosphate acyltransferase [Inhella gelatinilytica]